MSRHALSPTACWLFGLRPKVHNQCITTAYEVHNPVNCEGNVKTASQLPAKTVEPRGSASIAIGGMNALFWRIGENDRYAVTDAGMAGYGQIVAVKDGAPTRASAHPRRRNRSSQAIMDKKHPPITVVADEKTNPQFRRMSEIGRNPYAIRYALYALSQCVTAHAYCQ